MGHAQVAALTPQRSAAQTGAVLGVALMGSVDEIVFHQLLQWHHFYVHATEFWRIFSDGAFHALTTALWLVGAVMLWRRRGSLAQVLSGAPFWAGIFLGAGAFQLFDGTVNHKLLALHPVRVGAEDQWLYDALWIASALILLAWGRWLWVMRGRGRRL
ncbi:MAG TPA: DUF2243 domain-containing protein [Trueperaceae bacterium]|nr:DUF2243 domain-containing protein [Trueperaceae bacterium]